MASRTLRQEWAARGATGAKADSGFVPDYLAVGGVRSPAVTKPPKLAPLPDDIDDGE